MRAKPGDRTFNVPEALRRLFDGSTSARLGNAIADCVDGARAPAPVRGADPYDLALDSALAALKAAMIVERDREPTATGDAVSECCMLALPADWAVSPTGYVWVCGICGQWWEHARPAVAVKIKAPIGGERGTAS